MNNEIKKRIEQINNGDVPEGYCYSKAGLSPNDWSRGKLSDVLYNERRVVPKPKEPYWRIGIRSHAKGTFHEYVENPETVDMDELYVVRENDLIVCRPYFLYYLLKSTQGTKMVNAYAKRAIGQCSISARELLQHKFYFPNTLEEQIAIENVLMVQDRKIKLLDIELKQWQKKKKSLMQLLLTGIVRVK